VFSYPTLCRVQLGERMFPHDRAIQACSCAHARPYKTAHHNTKLGVQGMAGSGRLLQHTNVHHVDVAFSTMHRPTCC
jgi:hypothetical protein